MQPSQGDDGPAWPEDAVEVGKVLGGWGVKGWIRVHPYAADAPAALFSSRRWFLKAPESLRPAVEPPAWPALLKVIAAREHGDGVVAQVHDVGDRQAADRLKGATIHVARSSFPTPKPGEYYWVDLIGCDVVNRQGQALGQVVGLLDTGPHSVLQLRRRDGLEGDAPPQETLIPFVEAYVDQVDLPGRRIEVDWSFDD